MNIGFERLLKVTGEYTVLLDGKSFEIHGALMPLRYKNKMYLNDRISEIGASTQGYYLFLCEPSPSLKNGEAEIHMNGKNGFVVDRAETVFYMNRPVYQWAVLREIVE